MAILPSLLIGAKTLYNTYTKPNTNKPPASSVQPKQNPYYSGSSSSSSIVKQNPVYGGVSQDNMVEREVAVQPATNTSSNDYILQQQRELAEAQRRSRIAALDKQKDNELANLDTEQAGIDPYYYSKRNQAAAQSDIGAMNFAQFMAARGIKGNAGAMPEIYRNAGLQNQIGALDQSQAQVNADIGRRRTGIQNAYESDVVNANADIDAQALKNYIDQMNADRVFKLQQDSANREQMRYNDTRRDTEREQYVSTLGRFSDDYQAEINRVQNDNDTSNDWQLAMLQAARQRKILGISPEQQTAEAIRKTQLDNEAQEIANRYAPQIAQGQLDQLKLENEYKRLVNAGYTKEQAADLAAKYASIRQGDRQLDISQQNANTSANKGSLQYKDYVSMGRDMLDKGITVEDELGNKTYQRINTPQQTLDWVKGLPLSAEEKARLANDLGLSK